MSIFEYDIPDNVKVEQSLAASAIASKRKKEDSEQMEPPAVKRPIGKRRKWFCWKKQNTVQKDTYYFWIKYYTDVIEPKIETHKTEGVPRANQVNHPLIQALAKLASVDLGCCKASSTF